MPDLSHVVSNALREAAELRTGTRLMVAVSGGCDSMVLLHLLRELAIAHDWRLTAAHFNHHLRGRQSDLDESFVRKACKTLSVPLRVGRGVVRTQARRKSLSLEMAARDLRHAFLAREARKAGCRWVVTAHHADDQAELVLLRLLRGSGADGLSGMAACDPSPADPRVSLLRPLLGVRRDAIAAHAREHGVRFRDDASNRSLDHQRNRVRHELLPLLRVHYQPAVERVLGRVAEILRAEDQHLAVEAAQWLRRRRPGFKRLPLALQRRVVLLQARQFGVALDFDAVEHLVTRAGEPVNVSPGVFLQRAPEGLVSEVTPPKVVFSKVERPISLRTSAGRFVFGGIEIAFRHSKVRRWRRPEAVPGCERFDADAVGSRVLLRHWRAGDRFQPIGMRTAVKVQDLFTNLKVPVAERRRRVVAVAESGDIFWIEGLRIGERGKLTPASRRQLLWTWKRVPANALTPRANAVE